MGALDLLNAEALRATDYFWAFRRCRSKARSADAAMLSAAGCGAAVAWRAKKTFRFVLTV
jgi:hypothetical protein